MSSRLTRGRGTLAVLILMTMVFGHGSLEAQGFGSVKGRVVDRKTNDPLPGTNVVVQNTSLGAATDIEGKFTIRNVPAGLHVLRASYLGYVTTTIEVDIVKDSIVERDFRMVAQALTGEEVIITAQAQGQNDAINQQLSSNTISNIVSGARIKELPDVNAAESIGRLPGISINRSGGEASTVAIRGLSAKYNLVTINGQRLPATGDDRGVSLTSSINNPDNRYGGNDRSSDLSLISSNILDGIEVKKANTPDMDADVLGGTVDLKLKEAPAGWQMNVSMQGGFNQLQKYYGNYNFSASVSNRFLDADLGVIGTVNVDDYDRSADKSTISYRQVGLADLGYSVLDLREEKVKRGRTGASLLLDYRIPYGKLNSNLFYNRLHWNGLYRINRMDIEHGSHYYDLEDRHGTTDLFTGSLGVKQDYEWIRFDADVARSGSEGRNPNERTWRFAQEASPFTGVTITTPPTEIPKLTTIDSNTTKLADLYIFDTRRDEKQTSAQVNVEVPFRLGTDVSGYVKAGGKLRWLERRNDEEVSGANGLQYGGGRQPLTSLVRTLSGMFPNEWDYLRDSAYVYQKQGMLATRFLSNYSRSNFLEGDYPLGFPIDESMMNRFSDALMATPDVFQRYTVQSMGRDYDGMERYQAAYLMTNLQLGELITVLPGVRYESENSQYHGQRYRAVTTGGSHQGPPLDFTPLTSERSNEFWLPMVHLTVKPLDWLKIRLAGTQTLTRPDYRQYAPITYIASDQSNIVAANDSLKPARSTNLDLSISIFDNSVGLITVSGFHKKIDDLIFSTRYNSGPGIPPPVGSNIPASWLAANAPIYSYNMNNPYPAYIKGFEIEWQTHFWYLPSFLQGLVLSVNYTRIFSETEIQEFYVNRINTPPRPTYKLIDSSRTSRVPDQPAHIANVTLGYDYDGFSARLSYLFQTDKVSGIDRNPNLDTFTGEYARWDLTLQQSISEWGLQVFANLSNLNARPDRNFRGDAMISPTYTEFYGFTMDLGFRFKL